ncbi:hypothetical protein BZZ01_23000 [Nostocales cyanobacterium HT-58-2]|nr:hypothetical protein BZZ01_23000 [Nostocales cyanobacterium HT-58-2]
MKNLLTALLVVMNASILVHPALANEDNVSPTITNHGRASALVTQPATLTRETLNVTERTHNLKKVSESIGLVRDQGCKNFNPTEFLKSPSNTFKQCLEERKNQADQINQTSQPTETFDFFKVPDLDSGVNFTVTKF